ncbi:nucleotidyltransferase domain-containing protein [Methanocalculus sp.]|uniref:nucleotidyltransferase domain-containing protein n=1 Tax=Methanocalculus sp. TaxID=2004547 RepID=UPI002606689F|nr:nucleotidyltransferase domain-containing protein [Methanocalculus sp.]MDG6249275.1 nucleotidyltransferase domain-containing protein [Methanocalculus sp.]
MEQNITIQITKHLIRSDSYPRNLAKQINTSHTTVLRKLRELLESNVVDYRIEGKNTVYFLKKTVEARVYIYMAEHYRLIELIEQNPGLRPVIRTIQDHPDILLAILFGSYAKGTVNRQSDIDLYIETKGEINNSANKTANDRELTRNLERQHTKLSIKTGSFDPDNLLIQEIIQDHIILKGVERYYEKTGFFK